MKLSRLIPWRQRAESDEAEPLRPMFVITSMPVGGAETLLVNMMRRMNPELMRPEVICLKEAGPLGESIADEFPIHTHLLAAKWDLRVLPRLVRLMRRRRADAVITVGAGDKMFWGRLAAYVAGVPVIASALHSTGWPDGVGRLNRLLTPITDAFIAVANSHGEFLREFEGFPADKVHVIPNGVDCDRFHPDPSASKSVRTELDMADDAFLIGIVAALRSEKNHGMLVRAAAMLRKKCPDAHWLIVGDGPERESIESLIEDLQVADRVHLLGTRHDTPRILAALDVFTLCSLNEASPVSILEALACGVPVVATDVGSISESVQTGINGHLIPSRDPEAMVNAISALLVDPVRRREMGLAGRRLVVNTGSLQEMVNGYQELMTGLFKQAVWQLQTNVRPSGESSIPGWLAQLSRATPLRKQARGK